MKWWGSIKSVFGRAQAPVNGHLGSANGVLDFASFQRELHRRRALVDRAGGGFVLLVFEPRETPRGTEPVTLAELRDVVSSRARVSDVPGHHDEAHATIGVILPETDTSGARRFVESVEELLRNTGGVSGDRLIKCSVSRYPDMDGRVILQAEATIHEPAAQPAGASSGARA